MGEPVRLRRAGALAVLLWFVASCGTSPGISRDPFADAPTWRFADVAETGDARRRASNRLVGEALSDSLADTPRAQERIRRAIQIDPTNPWAYLALAREKVSRGEYEAAWAALDQTEARLLVEGEIPLGAQAHLSGLRGRAEAERLAPEAWSDQHLDAAELR